MIIGGEHIFSPRIFFKKSTGYIDNLIEDFKPNYDVNFTFGGYYSILSIIDSIKDRFTEDSIILLPSYLCSSILKPFKTRGIKYEFYKVDEELFIDTDFLISLINGKVKAIYFIDYFGVSQLERLQSVIEVLRSKNIIIIQDIVQCIEIRKEFLFGDFVFNSFRKFFPFEGSLLLSKNKLTINFGTVKNKYIRYKRVAQLLRYFHIKYGIFNSKIFLSLFRKAEKLYYNESIMKIPKFNLNQLNKIDIELTINRQSYYFKELYSHFSSIVPKLLHNLNSVPLGFVFKVKNRDEIRNNLFEKNIYPPIHWVLTDTIIGNHFPDSIMLSNTILTFPIIDLTEEKLHYLILNINKNLKDENIS